MTIRLLHIIPTLHLGGAEKQLALLACGLPREELDVHICTLTDGGPLETPLAEAGIPVHPIGKRWKLDPAAYLRLRRLIRELKPDIVHTWLFAANSYGRAAALAEGVRHVVAAERCVDPWKVWHELAIDRYLARRTERIVVNSEGVRDFYVSKRLPAEKFVVIPNGITVPEPAPRPDPAFRATLLEELELPPDAILIGTVGRLWPQKRHKDMIWATHLLNEIEPRACLLIVGDGPRRAYLERYTRLVQMTHAVKFLGQRQDVHRLLPELLCLWLASGYEGQSNAVMEAMAAAVPVVATDIPGNRDLVLHQETGYLVPLGDRAKFARWANQFILDPDLARRMGQAGRERMRQHFTVEQMIARYADFYRLWIDH